MSEATDKVLADFGGEVNGLTNDIAGDIDALLLNQGGATVEQLQAAFAPITEQLRGVAAKYPVVPPTEPPVEPASSRRNR